jgi:hypothetical protein
MTTTTATTGEAAPLPLYVQCSHTPNGCFAYGQLGPITGTYVSSPAFTDALLCISGNNFCDVAGANLLIAPGLVFGVAGVNGVGVGSAVVTLHFVQLALFSNSATLLVTASTGASGVIVVSAGVHRCLVVSGLSISAPPC